MSPKDTVFRSPLDKPLHLLTEEDISQVTREDCRRYLKEKGMRRPSWNKSQAIQQVISLKALLETAPDCDVRTLKKLCIPPSDPDCDVRTLKKLCIPPSDSAHCKVERTGAGKCFPYRPKDDEKLDLSGDLSDPLLAPNDSTLFRNAGATVGLVDQLTIFYCGKVNVYDDVPTDKAQAIIQFAANPLALHLDASFDVTTATQPLSSHLEAASDKVGPDCPLFILPTLQTVNMTDNNLLHKEERSILCEENPEAEGMASRKASVQRYLEKRKDRFKSKRKVGAPSSASFDIYLNHKIPHQTLNQHPVRIAACSPSSFKPLNMHGSCGLVENNIAKNANFSAGLCSEDDTGLNQKR